MSEQFVEFMFKIASKFKGIPINDLEKNKLVKSFNSNSGTVYERAKLAIEKVLNTKTIYNKSASLDDLNNILNEMNTLANNYL